MSKRFKSACLILVSLGVVLLSGWFLLTQDIAVLHPKGLIAVKQRNLMINLSLWMLIVVIPVFILTFFISWKYKASNAKAKYSPDWDYSILAESIWWGIPFIIVTVLGIFTWNSCHELDPFRPLESSVKPIKIQVIALDWKWLFIYPELNIATVNFVQFPEKTPINFEITADAPMNSFWIPKLGGQIYAMAGMNSKLHLIADEIGSYRGSSANLSGRGFSGMKFIAKASSQEEFDQWVQLIQQSSPFLGLEEYKYLVRPTENNPAAFYALEEQDLFEQVIMKYMMPNSELQGRN